MNNSPAEPLSLLTTARLRLRPLEWRDLPAVQRLLSDRHVMRFSLSGPQTPDEARGVLERLLAFAEGQPLAMYSVERLSDLAWLGMCGFLRTSEGHETEWEIAYRLLPTCWGQGYATEAVEAALRHAAARGITHISAFIEANNHASVRVAEKCGMKLQGATIYRGLPVQHYVSEMS